MMSFKLFFCYITLLHSSSYLKIISTQWDPITASGNNVVSSNTVKQSACSFKQYCPGVYLLIEIWLSKFFQELQILSYERIYWINSKWYIVWIIIQFNFNRCKYFEYVLSKKRPYSLNPWKKFPSDCRFHMFSLTHHSFCRMAI